MRGIASEIIKEITILISYGSVFLKANEYEIVLTFSH